MREEEKERKREEKREIRHELTINNRGSREELPKFVVTSWILSSRRFFDGPDLAQPARVSNFETVASFAGNSARVLPCATGKVGETEQEARKKVAVRSRVIKGDFKVARIARVSRLRSALHLERSALALSRCTCSVAGSRVTSLSLSLSLSSDRANWSRGAWKWKFERSAERSFRLSADADSDSS